MQKITYSEMSLYLLNEIEYNDPILKNQCIVKEEKEYITFLREEYYNNHVQGELYKWLEEGALGIIVWGYFEKDQIVNYKVVFSLEKEIIMGVTFPISLIRDSSSFNVKILDGGVFEFLCRLMAYIPNCRTINIGESNQFKGRKESYRAEDAYLYAYVFRYHINKLHLMQITEDVLNSICVLMETKKCFLEFQEGLNFLLSEVLEYEKIASYTSPFLVLIGGDICYGVLKKFSEDIAESLIKNGQAVIMAGDAPEKYDQLQNCLFKGIIGFQNKALEIEFFRNLHGPKFQFWLDYPLHFKGVLRNLPKEYYVLCQDADHAKQIRDYFGTHNAIQFSPGGVNTVDADWSVDRPYDIVFLGSNFRDSGDKLSGEQKKFYDFMVQNSSLNFEEGLCKMLNIRIEDSYTHEFMEKAATLKPACRAVIGHFREKVLYTLLEAGYSIHVYGDSWQSFEEKGLLTKLVRHPLVSVSESVEELKKAKIGLNIMSWHKAGMTERIANIMLSGAVCVSDESKYLSKHLGEQKEVVLFQLDEIDKLPEKIKKILEDEQYRKEIARRAYAHAKQEFSWNARARKLIEIVENRIEEQNKLRIFVATHVAFNPPNNPIYVPLHVGRNGKKDLGYIGDNTGENISDLNFLFGELTGLFWIWQNVKKLDYVGLCHYRRYFINEKMMEMQEDEYLTRLQNYDAIVPKHMECPNGRNYYEHFGRAHNLNDLNAVGRALKRLYPEYGDAYDKAMSENIFYWGNLVVTTMPILKAYAEWLFTIFSEASEEIDVSTYDDYHKRVYGFLSEQMFYVFAIENKLKLCEVSVGISAEKAETKELKEILKQLILQNRLSDAKELMERRLKMRPDLLLPGSDVNNELNDIYAQLQ